MPVFLAAVSLVFLILAGGNEDDMAMAHVKVDEIVSNNFKHTFKASQSQHVTAMFSG